MFELKEAGPAGAARAHARPWHRGSLFGAGPRRPLGRDKRGIWLERLDRAFREKQITALEEKVGCALLRRQGVDGQLDPSHATIAADASCSERTVRRALKVLAELGLVRWVRRLVRVLWPAGGRGATRVEQTSNAYELTIPDAPPAAGRLVRKTAAFRRSDCGGQGGRETPPSLFSPPVRSPTAAPPPGFPADPSGARTKLQEVASAMRAKLLGRKPGSDGK